LKLRYRLLQYIYSLAWQVTKNDYTIMRPLVMDWHTNRKVWDIGDQFMFGPAILVNPVTEAGATSRSVYLPQGTWYDFWSGERVAGDQTIAAAAPIDRIPLYVRAGSIVPMGPEVEYASEKSDTPIELRIYRGSNGQFTLYEDQGDTYAYEHGAYATIALSWDESSGTLTVGERSGSYPGMPTQMNFRVVWVSTNRGAGIAASVRADREVTYTGQEVQVKAP
jgi:alpha-D-xyloside xylohydrolase